MIPLLQKELDVFKDSVWNSHHIRNQNNTVLPDGIPNHIHSFPEVYGLEECGRFIKYNVEFTEKTIICIVQLGLPSGFLGGFLTENLLIKNE